MARFNALQQDAQDRAAELIGQGLVPERFAPRDPQTAAFATALAQETAEALAQGAPQARTLARFAQGLAALSETSACVPAAQALRDQVLARCPPGTQGLSEAFQEALRVAVIAELDRGSLLIHEAVRARQAWATPLNGPTPAQPPRRSPRP